MRRREPALASLFWLLALGGCLTAQRPVQLGHYRLDEAPGPFHETIALGRHAGDLRADQSRIGRTTVTLFAITSGDVTLSKPLREEIVREIAEALESLGYEIELIDEFGAEVEGIPTMAVSIQEFHFKNYTWFAPYIRTWGDIVIGVTLQDADGVLRYEERFTGSGASSCGDIDCGFTEASRKAMTQILNQLVTASGSEMFRLALDARPGSRSESGVAAPQDMDAPVE